MAFRRPYRLKATLTSKGQLTIPVELRRRWDLKPGDQIDFTLDEDDRVIIRKRITLTAADMRAAETELP